MTPALDRTLRKLYHGLIVSCQDYTEAMIKAALRGGCTALRVNAPGDVRLAGRLSDELLRADETALGGAPGERPAIVACWKVFFPGAEVYITPSVRAATALARAGADVVAFDATDRPRPVQPAREIIEALRGQALSMADVATYDEGAAAADMGADLVGTTLAPDLDYALIERLAARDIRVVAEGHVKNPAEARRCLDAGAFAVCVGTAITRPHLLVSEFTKGIQ